MHLDFTKILHHVLQLRKKEVSSIPPLYQPSLQALKLDAVPLFKQIVRRTLYSDDSFNNKASCQQLARLRIQNNIFPMTYYLQ